MTPSDFLTLLGLAAAVWSVVPKRERMFFLLFFPTWQIYLLAFTAIFLVHFLMSFDWLLVNWWPWLEHLTIERGIQASTYAYILALAVIGFAFTRVSVGFFSKSRIGSALEYYRALLDQGHTDVLIHYLVKYHLDDINLLLRKWSHMPKKSAMGIVLRRRTMVDEQYAGLIRNKRSRYALHVYRSIIKDETFVRETANVYPEVFARVISGMETENASDSNFVQLFIEMLFTSKNQKLVEELRILEDGKDSILERSKYIDLPIVGALMTHTKAAAENHIWYPVGKETIRNLKYDEDQKQFLRRSFDYEILDQLWSYKIYIAIVYFDCMVRETIYRDSGYHMWLYMYDRFIGLLIDEIILDHVEYASSTEYPSFSHYLIAKIVHNMTGWIRLAVDQGSEGQTIDVCESMGATIVHISECSKGGLNLDFRCSVLEKIIDMYFELSRHKNRHSAEFAMRHLESMLKNPRHPHWHEPDVSPSFLDILKRTWRNFDKEPYKRTEDNGAIQRFTSEVLIPLGIDRQ